MVSLADCNRKITELMYVLKAEIKMLRVGDFHNLNESSALKKEKINALVSVMDNLDDSVFIQKMRPYLAPRLAHLKSLSIENGILLQGIFNGVKSVQERIAVLENQKAHVGAYGPQGRILCFAEEPASSENFF